MCAAARRRNLYKLRYLLLIYLTRRWALTEIGMGLWTCRQRKKNAKFSRYWDSTTCEPFDMESTRRVLNAISGSSGSRIGARRLGYLLFKDSIRQMQFHISVAYWSKAYISCTVSEIIAAEVQSSTFFPAPLVFLRIELGIIGYGNPVWLLVAKSSTYPLMCHISTLQYVITIQQRCRRADRQTDIMLVA